MGILITPVGLTTVSLFQCGEKRVHEQHVDHVEIVRRGVALLAVEAADGGALAMREYVVNAEDIGAAFRNQAEGRLFVFRDQRALVGHRRDDRLKLDQRFGFAAQAFAQPVPGVEGVEHRDR